MKSPVMRNIRSGSDYFASVFGNLNNCVVAARRHFRIYFQIRRRGRVPSAHAVREWVHKSEQTDSANNGPKKSVRTPENIDRVRASAERSPKRSTRKRAQALRICPPQTTIIQPEDENENAVTVNSVRYTDMINQFLSQHPNRFPQNNQTWFQQDGAISHTRLFPRHIIPRRGGDIEWPSRSPDLTACDYFFWVYLKQKVFVDKPRTIRELKKY
ncbi:hypothetical protein ILUMI_10035 [Ignelater luminosus]|uniref:DUF4817 domain-containing protein n=1 Tax=Ignelater luminosus TaxID=2038154 RepID=A0A8K0D2T3_IGNLU|nr:hypothetical protein ILUMI_10035 [Ignelater luminosus]